MAKLPKSIIKKYGISKKAWSVFRGTKKTKSISRGYKMAKKKKYFKGMKGGFLNKALQVVIGAGVAVLYEVYVSPLIFKNFPMLASIKNILEMVLGVYLATSKKMPMPVRAGGLALATINAYELIAPFISGVGKRR